MPLGFAWNMVGCPTDQGWTCMYHPGGSISEDRCEKSSKTRMMHSVQKTWNKGQVRMESLHVTAVRAGLYGWSLLKEEKQNMIKQNKKPSKDHEL